MVREQGGTTRRTTAETRDRIIDGATTLFAKDGYHGTGISDIAEKVGLRGGALYYHIGSKEELLWVILSTYTKAVLEVAEEVAASDAPPTEKLTTLIVRQTELIVGSAKQMSIEMRDRSALSDERRAELQKIRERIQAVWQEILDEGHAIGEFASADAVVTNTIITTCNSVAHWYRKSGKYSPSEVADRVATIILTGVVGPA
ncbi:TetR/AcrR family transcriptional regulator [Cumulibacter soli]|uniref:TetR/AcrR family transcriptional regulator n=1 Tax=Cumulibacter soli TaxID=2546344 RepID=UPI001067743F|nr:TetR/AcrR family transcriptional regulator [Cumulibacter soli]